MLSGVFLCCYVGEEDEAVALLWGLRLGGERTWVGGELPCLLCFDW